MVSKKHLQYLLAGKNTLVVMPTGSGKSLIYQLAAMRLAGITLVISPLIALMKDQVDQLQKRSIPATFINSALPKAEQNRRLDQVKQGAFRIVYVAPERLRSLSFQRSMAKLKIGLLAVDEAHCISEWGHDFRPDYLNIADSRIIFGEPLTAALTATATPQVQADILRLLRIDHAEKIVTGFNRPNLALDVCYTTDVSEKFQCVQKLMTKTSGDGATIIYTGTRREAEETAEFLRQVCCRDAQFYHAGLPTQLREQVQETFMSGKRSLVVATNAFGMGIDRADVRQVIHFNLPGSLEAYYQEAGRAGRDGLPSVATLIYDPKDQALQEYFIKSSALSYDQLTRIFQALPEAGGKNRWLTADDLSRLTGLTDVQIRLGLSILERVEALAHKGDEGLAMQLEKQNWDEGKIQAALSKAKAFQTARKKQLEHMVRYAESNRCRRRILLDHFGDRGAAEAQDCCDNCRVRKASLKSVPERVDLLTKSKVSKSESDGQPQEKVLDDYSPKQIALIILDAVRRLKFKVGRERLAQVLHGSQAAKVKDTGLDQHTYYARLFFLRQSEILDLIDQLLQAGYFKLVGGQYPVLHLSPQGEMVIQQRQEIPLNLPKRFKKVIRAGGLPSQQVGSTVSITETLFLQGNSPEQIARQRELSSMTVYRHLAELVGAGKIKLGQLVSKEKQAKVEEAIRKVGSFEYLKPIKDLLPDEISYDEIRCVVGHWKQLNGVHQSKGGDSSQGSVGIDQTILDCVKALPGELPHSGKVNLPEPTSKMTVDEFLQTSHPRPLAGPWRCGWALGFHSSFSGANWQRSQVGEWTYRLKYKEDVSVLPDLVQQVVELAKDHPELLQVDLILPVPPSQTRPNDPVSAFARSLGEQSGIQVRESLVKSRQTEQQKQFSTLAQKKA